MQKKKIAIISSFTSLLITSSVAIPVSISSCSKKENITPIPEPNTNNITEFVDAINFTRDFFEKNYTFDMLKSDLENFANEYSKMIVNINNNNKYYYLQITPILKNNLLNLKVFLETNQNSASAYSLVYNTEFTNFIITPLLFKNTDGTFVAKLGIKTSWQLNPDEQYAYDSLEILKNKNPNWELKTIANQHITFINNINGQIKSDSNKWILLDTSIER
nr:hypothetical protein [Ureaplasma sp.]